MRQESYLRLVIDRWWIVLPILLVTVVAAAIFTSRQEPIYESTSTYLVKIRSSSLDSRTELSALDLLARAQIGATLAEIANSRLVKSEAAEALGLDGEQVGELSVNSRPIAGTNVMQISVEGPDPMLARDFASEIGLQTAKHAVGLYATYEMQLLDKATLPASPVSPAIMVNLLFGAVGGLLLGIGAALLPKYLQTPPEPGTQHSKIISVEETNQASTPKKSPSASTTSASDTEEVVYSRVQLYSGETDAE